MDICVKNLNVRLTRDCQEKFKHKCMFYDITEAEVISFFIDKFLEGQFDEELKLPLY